ncbi:MAG: potassium-transporting ATPase subunit KdpA [Nitrososphaerota archaeon]|nr:potassium-transporting ATPase subunit KdpA [Nitrososphaerota archaeon]MDG6929723.1 potassium-transporting ATPase subunit KdpA [Nitrososphaerota archaeon]MDG6932662.1 potassium-transporting ATPase subunit KdpA [Nitrososphaerota archaeon]MDG6944301.1 potassium-transporting ATPase subunit KdpA [Nitrososphaerota archaeon]
MISPGSTDDLFILLIFIILVISLSYLLALFENHVFFGGQNLVNKILMALKMYNEEMGWGTYFISMMLVNLLVVIIAGIILVTSLYPGYHITSSLLFNTLASFITNTDLEHFASEFTITSYGEAFALQFLEWIAPATGLSAAIAFIRSIAYGKIGNFFKDILSSLLLVFLPISLILSLAYIALGVPQTFLSIIKVPEPLGPISSLLPIMTLGNNGGSYYALGSAIALQNPNILTNLVESVSMLVFPFSLFWLFGFNLKNKKEGLYLLTASLLIFLIAFVVTMYEPLALFPFRIGQFNTKILTTASIFSNTGLLSAPLNGLSHHALAIYIVGMAVAMAPGSIGTGFISIEVYAILAIFFISLMSGRMPEYLNFKLNVKEIRLSSFAFLLHPILIYAGILFAIFILPKNLFPYLGTGFTQALWEIVSAAQNNGSDFYGVLGNTAALNYLTGVIMILGRYLFLMIGLLIANEFINKKKNQSTTKIRTDTPSFSITLVTFIFLLVIITLLPLLVLGPMASW